MYSNQSMCGIFLHTVGCMSCMSILVILLILVNWMEEGVIDDL